MSAQPIGEKAMSNTERSRRRIEREARYLESLKSGLMAASDALLKAGRDAQARGDATQAGELFRAAEAATLVIDSNLEGPSLADKLMKDYERKQEAYAMQRFAIGKMTKAKFSVVAGASKGD